MRPVSPCFHRGRSPNGVPTTSFSRAGENTPGFTKCSSRLWPMPDRLPLRMTPRAPDKKHVLLAFLERGVAMVHLDARRPGVSVPAQHAGEAHLRLNLSHRYGIHDFDVSDQRIQATLSF